MVSAVVSAGLDGGYLANPRLAKVHWQAGDRPVPAPAVSVAGESVLWPPRYRPSAVVRGSCPRSTWTSWAAMNWVIPVPTPWVLAAELHVDPVTIREITWALWDITPFYCPECRLNYCSLEWNMHFSVTSGHRHLLG